MQPADPLYSRHVLARLTDYCMTDGMPWTRRLWDIGSILALEELWEAGTWQSRHVLSAAAVSWQQRELARLVGPDHGIGTRELRRELTGLLGKGEVVDPSPGHRRLRHLIDHARTGYLDRWVTALQRGATVKPERLARTAAAHLLDLGYTAPYLTGQWAALSRAGADTDAIISHAADMASASPRTFEVLLAMNAIPNRPVAEKTTGYLNKTEVSMWLADRGHRGVRTGGGFVYRITARDPFGAADQVRLYLERMIARSQFMRKDRGGVSALSHLWVDGHPQPLPILPPARGADVLSLYRTGHLYEVQGERNLIDDALELAAPINQAAPGPAVAGAWAAVESLLSHPGDPVKEEERSGKAVAADRLAAIVACSWPRAELTTLIHRHVGDDEITRRRDACASNRERAHLLAEEISTHGASRLNFVGSTRHSDLAAAARMKDLLAEPRRVLAEVTQAVRVALRRLYRSRNVVLHGGSITSVSLDATLRTAAPLVGAGLDRVAHAYFESNLLPLDLAARAELACDLVAGETDLSVVDLLLPPRSASGGQRP